MPKTFNGSIDFTSNFNVQTTRPLDNRLVVDSYEDLTNGSIEAPYPGMVVNIAGTSQLWVLATSDKELVIPDSHDPRNWKLVTGSGGSGSGLGEYSIPVMTPEMVAAATEDATVDFDGSEDTHILVDDERLVIDDEKEDVYFGMIHSMMSVIKNLQAEVTRLKNYFDYGIDSYQGERTTISEQESLITDVDKQEPLWAIDPGIGLEIVEDTPNFYTGLDGNHKFSTIGTGTIRSITSDKGDTRLLFDDCRGKFYDGNEENAPSEKLTLYHITDSKLITYLVTDKPDIKMTLVSLSDNTKTKEIDFSTLIPENTEAEKYGFCIVLSRKDSTTGKGFNYIYFSIIDFNENVRICDGYYQDGVLVDKYVEDSEHPEDAYSILSLEFDRLTLSRMKFYKKYEDFSLFDDKEEVIPAQPDKEKYEVAHIAIRAVADTDQLNRLFNKGGLVENELIWNKKAETLHIKSGDKLYRIGSNSNIPDDEHNNNDNNMTDKQLIETLKKMGVIVHGATYTKDTEGNDIIESFDNISLAPIADITFINQETGKKFIFNVDTEGNLVGKYAGNDDPDGFNTIEEFIESLGSTNGRDYDVTDFEAVRGFISDYLFRRKGEYNTTKGVNLTSDAGKNSDRLRISSFYAPITTDETHGCTHSFIELENTSDVDIPLTGIYLHFLNPAENRYKSNGTLEDNNIVHHLALDGVIPAGGTYLIRGAKHAEFDDESAFIKVRTFDKEWYENGQPISFEQEPVKTNGTTYADDSPVKNAYRFCLTYGLPDLDGNTKLVERNTDGLINGVSYAKSDYPTKILNPKFIDSCSYSTLKSVSEQADILNPWYANGDSKGVGIVIKKNTMFRLTFALDPAKQAFNGFNAKDSSRVRYNKGQDQQILDLSREFIGFPHSNETIKVERYTPKASFEHKNVMTDKTQLDREKPNMVTCSFGVDVYNTRCFNWISCGTFDEYVWLRKKGETAWTGFESYKKVALPASNPEADTFVTTTVTVPTQKKYSPLVNNAVYARMINRFPGNDVLFTSHKCVVILPEATDEPVEYEYVVGRPNKDNKPDFEHTNEIYTFTLYPRSYEGRVYQITDQQGFHWIEYQVWAAAAEYLNTKIATEIADNNSSEYNKPLFPILLNTGDMTQSGARINEWLDYYNGGKSLFNHLEQMNCVGNNDLCPINPRDLGTGNDSDKSSSHFFHYFYCYDVKDTEQYVAASDDNKKFFSGESFVVKPHQGTAMNDTTKTIDTIDITEYRYIPSFYYFKTKDIMYVIVNSEIPITNCQKWFGLCSNTDISEVPQYVNIYTGIESITNGKYAGNVGYFTPLYETMYAWLNSNMDNNQPVRKVVTAMHEMPFTVITRQSLTNNDSTFIKSTRNHPTGVKSRVGSNVNQLNINESNGLCWCSRLLEYFNCKLVLGGHKHTYALSYPIKEKYNWTYTGTDPIDGVEKDRTYSSGEKVKPMFATLADEGNGGNFNVNWDIELTTENRNEYNIETDTSVVADTVKLNSTKTPYIPEDLYNLYGYDSFEGSRGRKFFRCCTPIAVSDEGKYDGFVTYSMCQATGYKLKSNKELPSDVQVFSKIIPFTDTLSSSDAPNANQLYPMYSVLDIEYDDNDKVNGIAVSMNRIGGILASPGSDKFDQGSYGKGDIFREVLCTFEKEECKKYKKATIAERDAISDAAGDDLCYVTATNKIYIYNSGDGTWSPYRKRMYGVWKSEREANEDMMNYQARPNVFSDNRYLHIKF